MGGRQGGRVSIFVSVIHELFKRNHELEEAVYCLLPARLIPDLGVFQTAGIIETWFFCRLAGFMAGFVAGTIVLLVAILEGLRRWFHAIC